MQEVVATLTRRSLLKTGLFGTLVVGLGSLGLARRSSLTQPDTPPLTLLDASEYAVLAAVADRLCPALGEGAPGARTLGVAHTIDGMLAEVDPESVKGLRIALRVFESALTGALMGERIAPFTQLSAAQQEQVLAGWRDAGVGFRRTVYRALSKLIFSVYWGHRAVWPRIGYPGPPDPAGLREAYADQLVDLAALRAKPASAAKPPAPSAKEP